MSPRDRLSDNDYSAPINGDKETKRRRIDDAAKERSEERDAEREFPNRERGLELIAAFHVIDK